MYSASRCPRTKNDAVVEFYVQAEDASGQTRTLPAASDDTGGQNANFLYQVDDVERDTPTPVYRSIMTPLDREAFRVQNRFSDAQSNATFIATMGGVTEARYNVGVRYRGSGSRTDGLPNNRINFPSDKPWRGITQVNMNTVTIDDQIGGSAVFHLAGLAAADAFPVRMLSNNVDLANGRFYTHLEVLGGDWAQNQFPDDGDGNVYRGRRAGEGPPGGGGAGLAYLGEDPSRYVSYLKMSNRSEADYSDVMELTDVLNNTPDDEYLEAVARVVDIEQWLRVIALHDYASYGENGLITGDAGGDDYAMYRGVEDPRFHLVPYDLDSMFGAVRGQLLTARGVPALRRLLDHPEIRPRYYAQLFDLMENAVTPEKVRTFLDGVLGDIQSTDQIQRVATFFENRREHLRDTLPTELTVTSQMPEVDGYYTVDDGTTREISGTAHIAKTRRVEVGGVEATWDPTTGAWRIADLPLAQPGLNRLRVVSFNEFDQIVDETFIDVLQTNVAPTVVQNVVNDTTWTVANGPYIVNGRIDVQAGATLTIEPGTTIQFAGGSLNVSGTLVAQGTSDLPIWFVRQPGSNGFWQGIQFRNSDDNRVSHSTIRHAQTLDGAIGLDDSAIQLDSVTFEETALRRIRTIDSSLVVRNSHFSAIRNPGEAPLTDNQSEHIWGRGIPNGGQWVLENNFFGHSTGHNDSIDFDAPRLPGPIPIIRNNEFEGGGDDALDMTGDVWVEGNLFQNFIKDQFNVDPGESNTISASQGTFYVTRNVFHNVQHAALIKEESVHVFCEQYRGRFGIRHALF